jgi:hypothetical protein
MKATLTVFATEAQAFDRCRLRNKACKDAGNSRDLYAVVEGPDCGWCVVDLDTAIEMDVYYTIVYA